MGHGHCHSLNQLSSIQLFEGLVFYYFDAGNACNVVLKPKVLLPLEELVEQCRRPCPGKS
jgi:hypothetical protein